MTWPPRVGDLLPRSEEAVGVRDKLANYSLNFAHEQCAAKARGFALILGITLDSIDYLGAEIRSGIRHAPISRVRLNPPYGVNCVVEFPLCGVGEYSDRVSNIRTVWELAELDSPPCLINAFPRPREENHDGQ